jgi:hypothetical protein
MREIDARAYDVCIARGIRGPARPVGYSARFGLRTVRRAAPAGLPAFVVWPARSPAATRAPAGVAS